MKENEMSRAAIEERVERNIRRLKDLIAQGMRKNLTVREQAILYRYIYYAVIARRRRGDADFVPEPFPAADLLPERTRQILEIADQRETLWAWAVYRKMKKNG